MFGVVVLYSPSRGNPAEATTRDSEMKVFAFISRHVPTQEQHDLALLQGVKLVVIGDYNAFTVTPDDIFEAGENKGYCFDGVVVVHPAAALTLIEDFQIGIFENGNRAAEGEKPQFFAKAFHIWN